MTEIELTKEELMETYLSIVARKQVIDFKLTYTEDYVENLRFWENISKILTHVAKKVNPGFEETE